MDNAARVLELADLISAPTLREVRERVGSLACCEPPPLPLCPCCTLTRRRRRCPSPPHRSHCGAQRATSVTLAHLGSVSRSVAFARLQQRSPALVARIFARLQQRQDAFDGLADGALEEEGDEDEDKKDKREPFPWLSLFMLVVALGCYMLVSRHNVSFGPLVPAVNTVAVVVLLILACRQLATQ